jgi:hypothetical protein
MTQKHANPRIGSAVDDLLEEEGLLDEATAAAAKRVLVWHIAQEMEKGGVSKAEMARRMHTSRAALERLLDPENASVTLGTINRAATALGKRVRLELVDAA